MAVSGVMNTGGNLGGIIGIPIVGYLSGEHLWHTAFVIGADFRSRARWRGSASIESAGRIAADRSRASAGAAETNENHRRDRSGARRRPRDGLTAGAARLPRDSAGHSSRRRAGGALRGAGAQVAGMSGDVSSEAFVQQLAQWIAREYGAADALVNNAGISLIAPAEQTTAAQWQRVMDINLFGPFLLCRYLGAQMLERRHGSIVNVASVAGLAGVSHRSAYNASKHGLIGLTADAGGGVGRARRARQRRVSGLDQDRDGCGGPGQRRLFGRRHRQPRADGALRAPEDVAEAIAFLIDGERSGFINGVSLPVDGGWIADASWDSLRLRTRASVRRGPRRMWLQRTTVNERRAMLAAYAGYGWTASTSWSTPSSFRR
jgi:NAD(P)-dependent dehydrogenase (short-subunit alcohol dehydrogenase family)